MTDTWTSKTTIRSVQTLTPTLKKQIRPWFSILSRQYQNKLNYNVQQILVLLCIHKYTLKIKLSEFEGENPEKKSFSFLKFNSPNKL